MVTETALQRCVAEMCIEHCHYFFPDLPEVAAPAKITPTSSVTFTSDPSSPPSFSPTSLQSYTTKSSEFSSAFASNSEQSQDASLLSKPKEELPHPLAESALDEGVTVVLDGSVSPKAPYKRNNSSPVPADISKTRSLPRAGPPVPAPRSNSGFNLTPPESPSFSHRTPPSPAPRSRHGTGSSTTSGGGGVAMTKTSSGEPMAGGGAGGAAGENGLSHNGRSEEGADHTSSRSV